MCDPTDNLNI